MYRVVFVAKRSKSSQRWLQRQQRDPYAQDSGAALSRAYHKLEQLDAKYRLLRAGSLVLELGAAPGGWTQYMEQKVTTGRIVAVDFRPISASSRVDVILGEYGQDATDAQLAQVLPADGVDLVLSDMAPNMSGIRVADQARAMDLAELAEDAAQRWLKPGGELLVKVFEGAGLAEWREQLRSQFAKVINAKPPASRSESRELYILARGFLGDPSKEAGGQSE